MNSFGIRRMTTVAVLVACEVVLTRFLSIPTPIVRIGLGFLPVAVIAMMYGPVWAACAAVAGDLIGASLFPTGPFFPGFTLTAALTGLVFGLLLYKKPKSWARAAIAAGIVCIGLNLVLDSWWIEMMYGKGLLAILPTRALKSLLMIPVQVIGIRLSSRALVRLGRGEMGEAQL